MVGLMPTVQVDERFEIVLLAIARRRSDDRDPTSVEASSADSPRDLR